MILSVIGFDHYLWRCWVASVFSNLEMEQLEQDPDYIMLSRQFKATATELISVLELVKPCSFITSNNINWKTWKFHL